MRKFAKNVITPAKMWKSAIKKMGEKFASMKWNCPRVNLRDLHFQSWQDGDRTERRQRGRCASIGISSEIKKEKISQKGVEIIEKKTRYDVYLTELNELSVKYWETNMMILFIKAKETHILALERLGNFFFSVFGSLTNFSR